MSSTDSEWKSSSSSSVLSCDKKKNKKDKKAVTVRLHRRDLDELKKTLRQALKGKDTKRVLVTSRAMQTMPLAATFSKPSKSFRQAQLMQVHAKIQEEESTPFHVDTSKMVLDTNPVLNPFTGMPFRSGNSTLWASWLFFLVWSFSTLHNPLFTVDPNLHFHPLENVHLLKTPRF